MKKVVSMFIKQKWKKDRAYDYLKKIANEIMNNPNFLQNLDKIFYYR